MKSEQKNKVDKSDDLEKKHISDRAEEFEKELHEENMSLYRKFKLQNFVAELTSQNSNSPDER